MKTRTTITLTIVGLLALTGIFYAANPTQFGTVGSDSSGPVGVAAAPDLLLVTENSTGNLDQINCSGKVSLLTTIPGAVGSSVERYLAIAPSQSANAGFTPRDIFVTQGAEVYKISGGVATLFATIPGAPEHYTGITFDHVGTFGYNMILTTSDPNNFTNGGKVYRIDGGGGTPTLIADLSGTTQTIEGPAVVPSSFGTYQGQILVADEFYNGSGAVHAIDNTGHITYEVFDWYGAESVIVIPPASAQCALCSGGGSFFQAIEDLGAIYQSPPTDFTVLGGNVLVAGEDGAGCR